MKLKYSFEPVDMGNEIICVPVGSDANRVHGVVKLNKEGQEIFNLLQKEISKEQIIDQLAIKYDNERKEFENWVTKVLDTLQQAGLIEE